VLKHGFENDKRLLHVVFVGLKGQSSEILIVLVDVLGKTYDQIVAAYGFIIFQIPILDFR
jgi:hypothetical protein